MEELMPKDQKSVTLWGSREEWEKAKRLFQNKQFTPNWTAISDQSLLGEILEHFFKFKCIQK